MAGCFFERGDGEAVPCDCAGARGVENPLIGWVPPGLVDFGR